MIRGSTISRRLALAGAVVAMATPVGAQDATDRLVVPGERFGAITARSTPADVKRVYGANARVGTFQTGEGPFWGVEMFAGKPDYLRVYATDDRKRVQFVETSMEGSTWRTADGIRVGAGLDVVVKANGRGVTMAPYEGEGGGFRISDFRGGRLTDQLATHFFAGSDLSEADHAALGKGLDSDHAIVRRARFAVYRFGMTFG